MHWLRNVTLVISTLLLCGCANTNYNWGWYVVSPTTSQGQTNLKFLISGLGYTISLSLIAIAISVLVGLAVALPGLTKSRTGRIFNRLYVETFRSIPMLVMILWIYYGLPVLLNIDIGVFTSGILALALCDSAFEAEIFRAGIQQNALYHLTPSYPPYLAAPWESICLYAQDVFAGFRHWAGGPDASGKRISSNRISPLGNLYSSGFGISHFDCDRIETSP